MASSTKLERLLNLTALLLAAPRPLTADDIQEQLEQYPRDLVAFRRAFERDKDELRGMGIPLRVQRVPGRVPEVDGYRIPPEEYGLRDRALATDDLAALHRAAPAVPVGGLHSTARTRVVEGKRVTERVDLGGRSSNTKKKD